MRFDQQEQGAISGMSFFVECDGQYHARGHGVSQWSSNQVNGPAVCGLLARQLETHCPAEGVMPARLTVDMLRPVLNEPIAVHSTVVRKGSRVILADATIVQQGELRARASAVFLVSAASPPGEIWQPQSPLPVPQARLISPDGDPPLLRCGESEWTDNLAAGRNADRKVMWQNLIPLIEGEAISPFQRAAAMGDATNFVCHWGSEGIGFINTDLTLTLSRLPEGPELGLQAQDQSTSGGVAVGTATLYDRSGRLGTCVVTAVADARRPLSVARSASGARAD
ncbi:thioesterase family protein [Nocardia sp. SYP-A9097]|uniref:thioesterase family protein n=1 Tax=Nocardia sp. SYP-A9097 TaxID=2663237 RepID=UPI001E4B2B10|nr:thioesterase family protein [Nocardia sp. SYP-A9097]